MNTNWKCVEALCRNHAQQIREGQEDEDMKDYIYEAAMTAVFGHGIFADFEHYRKMAAHGFIQKPRSDN